MLTLLKGLSQAGQHGRGTGCPLPHACAAPQGTRTTGNTQSSVHSTHTYMARSSATHAPSDNRSGRRRFNPNWHSQHTCRHCLEAHTLAACLPTPQHLVMLTLHMYTRLFFCKTGRSYGQLSQELTGNAARGLCAPPTPACHGAHQVRTPTPPGCVRPAMRFYPSTSCGRVRTLCTAERRLAACTPSGHARSIQGSPETLPLGLTALQPLQHTCTSERQRSCGGLAWGAGPAGTLPKASLCCAHAAESQSL